MKRVEQAHLPVVALTHPGMKGKNNEDSFAVSAFEIGDKKPIPVLLSVLSDGIGGHRAGEVAARVAVDTISERIARSDGEQPVQTLSKAVEAASEEIYAMAQQDAERHGMGATISCLYIIGNRLYTAAIGDSRIYLMRNGNIQQITIDHTWIQEALDGGLITPDQVAGHPHAHVIRRYLGGPKPPAVDTRIRLSATENDAQSEANQGMLLKPGDFLLSCSDGLTDLVKDHEILAAVKENPLQQAAQSLIDLANQRGGHDNITVVIVQMPDNVPLPEKSGARWSTLTLGCIGLVILAVLAAGAGWAWMWFTGNRLIIQPFGETQTPEVIPSPPGLPGVSPTLQQPLSPDTMLTQKPLTSATPNMTLTFQSGQLQVVTHTMTAHPTNTTGPPLTETVTMTITSKPNVKPSATITPLIQPTKSSTATLPVPTTAPQSPTKTSFINFPTKQQTNSNSKTPLVPTMPWPPTSSAPTNTPAFTVPTLSPF